MLFLQIHASLVSLHFPTSRDECETEASDMNVNCQYWSNADAARVMAGSIGHIRVSEVVGSRILEVSISVVSSRLYVGA